MSQQASPPISDEEVNQLLIFTPADFAESPCGSQCFSLVVVKKMEKLLNDKDKYINELTVKVMHNDQWKLEMAKRWNTICDKNRLWCKDYLKLETEKVDLEVEVQKLKQQLESEQEKMDDQKEENQELQRKHNVTLTAFKELVTGIFLITKTDNNESVNDQVKPVQELTATVFAEFVNKYCSDDVEM